MSDEKIIGGCEEATGAILSDPVKQQNKEKKSALGTRKRNSDGTSRPREKRSRKQQSVDPLQKTPLQKLNELNPAPNYVCSSQEGPLHHPTYTYYTEIDGVKYEGKGESKQLAKNAVAEAYFDKMQPSVPCNAECSSLNNVNDGRSTSMQKANEEGELSRDRVKNLHQAINDFDKKFALVIVNQLHPKIKFSVEENIHVASEKFTASMKYNNDVYKGSGPNKQAAKAAAAEHFISKYYGTNLKISMAPTYADSGLDPEVFWFKQSLADDIAQAVFNTYEKIMVGNEDYLEWKVLAGVVMTVGKDMEEIRVIGIGTGTKHMNGEYMTMNGTCLQDCHAEIISRRCLKDYLYTQLMLHVQGNGDTSILEMKPSGKYGLKDSYKFHLFTSKSPCGDSRMFSIHDDLDSEDVNFYRNPKRQGLLRAKIKSGELTVPIQAEHCIQTSDGIKQGQRFLAMSCSDKVASWNVVGAQGALLSYFIEPVYMETIIIGKLFHPHHTYRALFGRLERMILDLPIGYQKHKPKMCGTSYGETRQISKSPSHSITWTLRETGPEIIDTETGRCKANNKVSRLAKRSFHGRFAYIHTHLKKVPYESQTHIYSKTKKDATEYHDAKQQLKDAFAANNLGSWIQRPIEQEQLGVDI